ncbi:cell wall anchor protein [Pelomyxa schiedti]|nr:cell wall anchor protein [Pelomyxa schiedti]
MGTTKSHPDTNTTYTSTKQQEGVGATSTSSNDNSSTTAGVKRPRPRGTTNDDDDDDDETGDPPPPQHQHQPPPPPATATAASPYPPQPQPPPTHHPHQQHQQRQVAVGGRDGDDGTASNGMNGGGGGDRGDGDWFEWVVGVAAHDRNRAMQIALDSLIQNTSHHDHQQEGEQAGAAVFTFDPGVNTVTTTTTTTTITTITTTTPPVGSITSPARGNTLIPSAGTVEIIPRPHLAKCRIGFHESMEVLEESLLKSTPEFRIPIEVMDTQGQPCKTACGEIQWKVKTFPERILKAHIDASIPAVCLILSHKTKRTSAERSLWIAVSGRFSIDHGPWVPLQCSPVHVTLKPSLTSGGPAAKHHFWSGKDSDILCWGENELGQLGLGDYVSRSSPILMNVEFSKKIKSISCGAFHSAAVASDWSVLSWGSNNFGQLGLGDYLTPQCTPTVVPGLFCKRIYCGGNFTVGVSDSGQLISWGENSSGQLGLGDFSNHCRPQRVRFDNNTGISLVACGWSHTLISLCSNTLLSCGNNSSGQLGLGDWKTRNLLTVVEGLFGIPILSMSCGVNHSVVVIESGDVYAWGANNLGQIGVGDCSNKTKPYAVVSSIIWGRPTSAIECGANHSFAILDSGDVLIWGDNSQTQLTGKPPRTIFNTPHVSTTLSSTDFTRITCGESHTLLKDHQRFRIFWGTGFPELLFDSNAFNDKRKLISLIVGWGRGTGNIGTLPPVIFHSLLQIAFPNWCDLIPP